MTSSGRITKAQLAVAMLLLTYVGANIDDIA